MADLVAATSLKPGSLYSAFESKRGLFVEGGEQLRLWCGDFFQLQAEDLAEVKAVYDRAALIALPAEMRKAYAELLCSNLPSEVSVLLVTLESEQGKEQGEEQGPPFSVAQSEVEMLFGKRFAIELLDDHAADRPGTREKVYLLRSPVQN